MSVDLFFCLGKKDFCDNYTLCKSCEFADGEGGIHVEDLNQILGALFGEGYDIDRLRELVEADRERRCVVFKFGLGSTVYRAWVRPDGSHPFVAEERMNTVNDLVNAENWGNAYTTYEAAEAALKAVGVVL